MNLDNLAPKIAKRDKDAFEYLYEKLKTPVYAVSLSVLNNSFDAEEIMQDTFVAVWEKIDTFKGKGFKTWVVTIARNKALNRLEKKKREFSADFSKDDGSAGAYNKNSEMDKSIVLEAALGILDSDSRQIVLMKTSGLKMKEIADFMGIPRGTASWKYSEAIKRLQNHLKEDGHYEKV